MKYTIDTLFHLQSPLHVSQAGQYYYDPENPESKWLLSYKAPNNGKAFPVTRTMHCPSVLPSAEGGVARQGEGHYYPGNSLRGGLRRMGTDLVLEALARRKESISFDLYHVLSCGSSSSQPLKSATVKQAAESARHPFVSLFGGGPGMIWSRMSVGALWPITAANIAGRLIPAHYAEHSCGDVPVNAIVQFSKVDDVLRGTGIMPQAVHDFAPGLEAWLQTLQDSRTNRDAENSEKGSKAENGAKSKEKGKKVALSLISAREVICPGVRLHGYHKVDTELAGEAALGLFILSLERFAARQRLGGCFREGFGRFSLQATFRAEDGNSDLLSQVDDRHVIARHNPIVSQALQAWDEFAGTITASSLHKAFMIGEG